MKTWIGLLLMACVGFSAGCGGDDDDDSGDTSSSVDCSKDTTTYDDVAIFDKCQTCHSSELSGDKRMKAPANINFDTAAAAKANAKKAESEVKEGAMPPKTATVTVTDAEKQQLYTWVDCGAKE